MSERFYVYILASWTRVLYIGVTNNLLRRVYEHREKVAPGFSSKFRLKRLVYFETFDDARSAIEREKQLKSWRRERKLRLIESMNPKWHDLSPEIA